ncbi:MAG: hypothetical protein ACFFDQ_12180 [Candidatus Thorarchaeota archaeon]
MRIVGSAMGIDLHAPKDAYFSYFNSPYIGHDLGSAIDIYPRHQEWNGDVLTPVAGKIVRIRKIKMGQPKKFPTYDYDYGIGILPDESQSDIVRIMHCEPIVSEGESVNIGDCIGKAIRSRFFNYWTGPHYHVEIMPLKSFSRSSKSYPLELEYKVESKAIQSFNDNIEFLVKFVNDDHVIGYADNLGYSSIGDLIGLPAIDTEKQITGILDGGFSHYKIGGVIGTENFKPGTQVHLGDSSIGTVSYTKSGASLFRRGPSIIAFLDETEIRGISCFLYTTHYTRKKTPQLILIPKTYGQFTSLFHEGDLCELRITNYSNRIKAGLSE